MIESYFGPYTVQGLFDKDPFNNEMAYLIGRAFGTVLRRTYGHNVCVVRDGNKTSIMMEEQIVQGLLDSGLHVMRLGLGPLSFLRWSEKTLLADASIFIHHCSNIHQNKILFMLRSKPFYGDQIQRLLRLIEARDFIEDTGTEECLLLLEQYSHALFSSFCWGKYTYTLIWDASSGTSCPVLNTILNKIPGEHILLHGSIDEEPSQNNWQDDLSVIQHMIAREKCDFGFIICPLGEKLTLIDNHGKLWSGDELFLFFAQNILASAPESRFVLDIHSSPILANHLRTFNSQIVLLDYPEPTLMQEAVEQGDFKAGGHSEGYFFLKSNNNDNKFYGGLYNALQMLSLISFSGISLEAWYNHIPPRSQKRETRMIACHPSKPQDIIQGIRDDISNKDNISSDDMDSLIVREEKGIWALTPSSHKPSYLTANWDAYSEDGLQDVEKNLQSYLSEKGLSFTQEKD